MAHMEIPILPITFIDNKKKYPEDKLELKLGLLRVSIHSPITTKNMKIKNANSLRDKVFSIINESLIQYENK